MKSALTFGLVLACGVASAAHADNIANLQIGQNQVTAQIVDATNNVLADLNLTFEQSVGLTADSIGLTAHLVDPTDAVLTARLPASNSIQPAFPVVFAIEPPMAKPLSFSGVVSIDLHVHTLTYTPNSPLRLLAAEAGGNFRDITSSTGIGSYRTGASKGGFSEFVVCADVRSVDSVIIEKFKRLQSTINANAAAIPNILLGTLQASVNDARSANLGGDPATAADDIQQFADSVQQNSGTLIPNVWRSARDIVNVAGELRGAAATLKFSLLVKANGGS